MDNRTITSRLKRKNFYSNKDWWTRTMWALEATASPSDRMFGYGAAMLIELARSDAASKEEKVLLDAVWSVSGTQMRDTAIRQLLAEQGTASEPRDEAEARRSERGLEKASFLYREVLAARLKVILDEQFRRETSPLVSELAKIHISLTV